MNTRFRATALLFVVACLFVGTDVRLSHAQGFQTKIGAFTHSVTNDAYAAKAFEQGLQLAIEKRPKPSLAVRFFDVNQGNSPDSAALKSLIESDKAPLVIYWEMNDVNPVASFLTTSEVTGLVSWEVTKKMPTLGSHIFGFGYSTELSFKEFAKFAEKKLKGYRAGILTSAAARFEAQSKAFTEQWKSQGDTVVFEEKIESGTSDFKSALARAQSEKCDTIVATLPPSDLISFVKAARLASFKGNILVGDGLFAPEIAQLGKDAEGIYMTQAWSTDAPFGALYSAKYGASPDSVTLGAAALGYDVVNCILDAGSPLDSSSIEYSMLSKSCEGLTGKTQFSGERMALRRKSVVTVKEGKFVLAE